MLETICRPTLGRLPEIDTTKIRKELGMTFRPLEETEIDVHRYLVKWAHVAA